MLSVQFAGKLQLKNKDVPEISGQQSLLKLRLAGICRTDLEIVKGYMGFTGVLGHEFVAEVVQSPEPEWIGQRVVADINLACGDCPACHAGLGRHCQQRTVLGIQDKDGAMSEFFTLPTDNLLPVADHIPDEVAVFAEPMAAALEIAEQLHLKPGQPALVLGDGKLGLLIVYALLSAQQRVSLLGHHKNHLELAASWGAQIAEPQSLQQFPLVVEATGSAAGLQTAIEATVPRGTLVLKSTYAGSVELNAAPLVINEITVLGSRCGPVAAALELLGKSGNLIEPLIERCFDLDHALEAFALAAQPGVLKVLLQGRR